MTSGERAGRALSVATVVFAVVLGISPAAVAGAGPVVTLDPAEAAVGEPVTVRLAGWSAGSVVVELCGNQGRRGSLDCLVSGGVTASVSRDGAATASVRVRRPPVGCPCVVRVRPIIGGAVRTAPLVIAGVAVGKPSSAGTRKPITPAVTHAELSETSDSSGSLFILAAHRTLVVTIRNGSTTSVAEPRLSLTAGRPGRTTVVVEAPPILPLSPGEQRTYRIPVTFDAPVWGRYTVRGELAGTGEPVVFHTHTSSYPWAILASPLLMIAGLLRWFARRQTGHSRRTGPVDPGADPGTVKAGDDVVQRDAPTEITDGGQSPGAPDRLGRHSTLGDLDDQRGRRKPVLREESPPGSIRHPGPGAAPRNPDTPDRRNAGGTRRIT